MTIYYVRGALYGAKSTIEMEASSVERFYDRLMETECVSWSTTCWSFWDSIDDHEVISCVKDDDGTDCLIISSSKSAVAKYAQKNGIPIETDSE